MNNKELSSIIKNVNSWYSKRIKVLSIKSRPYNSIEILFSTIYRVLNEGDKVLYVWCSRDKSIIRNKENKLINGVLEYAQKDRILDNIKFVTIDEVKFESEEYDLVIFDDISFFSKESIESVRSSVEDIYWKSRKILIYSCEYIFPIGGKLEIPYLNSKKPMVEPRIISTRIKLDEDIPLALFDYYNWFKENKKKILIMVPNEKKLNKVYEKYHEILSSENTRVIKHNKGEDFKNLFSVISNTKESVFIITNNINEYITKLENISVVLLFADDIFYNYKKILNICAAINSTNGELNEVLLVSKESSDDIDKARNIIRGFNKRLWEKNLKK